MVIIPYMNEIEFRTFPGGTQHDRYDDRNNRALVDRQFIGDCRFAFHSQTGCGPAVRVAW